MKVSVIVPVYNAEPWIKKCMDSIMAQTYKGFETLVINDPNGKGAAYSRNKGLDGASGEYIAFCDADDYLEPDAIENMVVAMGDADMVVGSFRKFGDFSQTVQSGWKTMGRKEVAEYAMENLKNPRTNQMLSGCWAKLYKRDLIGKFPLLTTAEDMAFNFDYLKRCEKVRFLDTVVYNNRKRQGSLSTTYNANDKPGLFGFLPALRYVRTFLEEFYTDEEIENVLDNSKVYHSLLYFTRIMAQTKKPPREVFMELYP